MQAFKRKAKGLGWLAALLAMYPDSGPRAPTGLPALARRKGLQVRLSEMPIYPPINLSSIPCRAQTSWISSFLMLLIVVPIALLAMYPPDRGLRAPPGLPALAGRMGLQVQLPISLIILSSSLFQPLRPETFSGFRLVVAFRPSCCLKRGLR